LKKKPAPEINPLIFPGECLLQLEENVFTDNWSIPYKTDEIIDHLLNSTIVLLKNGIPDKDAENVKRFMDRVIPEVYKKVITYIYYLTYSVLTILFCKKSCTTHSPSKNGTTKYNTVFMT
jgi:hypothetical protein